jgi:hypothetical protein
MSEKDLDPDDDDTGMTEGEIHSGPGGYEGMGYSGGYAAEHFGKDDDEEKDDDDDDFNEDEANRY